jgi:hypothetical protein
MVRRLGDYQGTVEVDVLGHDERAHQRNSDGQLGSLHYRQQASQVLGKRRSV